MVTFHFHAKILHAPRYSEVEFPRLPLNLQTKHLFYQERPTFPGYPSICRKNIRSIGKGLPSNKGILFRSSPIFLNRWVCQTSHISSMETYPIPKVSLSKQARLHAPWVSVLTTESLVLIRWTNWRLMRHSLCKKAC